MSQTKAFQTAVQFVHWKSSQGMNVKLFVLKIRFHNNLLRLRPWNDIWYRTKILWSLPPQPPRLTVGSSRHPWHRRDNIHSSTPILISRFSTPTPISTKFLDQLLIQILQMQLFPLLFWLWNNKIYHMYLRYKVLFESLSIGLYDISNHSGSKKMSH